MRMRSGWIWLCLPALAALALAACGAGGAGTSEPPSGGTPAAVSHGGPARDYVSFLDQLRATGATVTPDGTIERTFFAVGGYAITADGEHIQVYEYANDAAMAADAATVSADGYTVGRTKVEWVAPPHFYRAGRIIVVYPGASATTLQRLTTVLGAQFAGK
jgi:hypothetical protein